MTVMHEPVTVSDIDAAIAWLTREVPANPMQRHPVARAEMSAAIHSAAAETKLDPYLLAYQIYKESSYDHGSSGTLGEVGLGQQHGVLLNRCVRVWKLDMTRVSGQVLCTAKNLRRCADDCGSVAHGLTAYASGSCNARTDTTARKIASRLKAARALASKPWED